MEKRKKMLPLQSEPVIRGAVPERLFTVTIVVMWKPGEWRGQLEQPAGPPRDPYQPPYFGDSDQLWSEGEPLLAEPGPYWGFFAPIV